MTHRPSATNPARTDRRFLGALVASVLLAALAPVVAQPAQASFPGENGKLAFVRNGNIIVQDPSPGATETQLTDTNLDSDPAFAPDGSRLAFVRAADGNFEILTMAATGGAATNVTNDAALDEFPAYSPDKTKITFDSNRDGNFEIYTMNADGSGVTRVTNNPADDFDPRWSPDGRRLVFASDRDGDDLDLFVVNADGSGLVQVTTNGDEDLSPTWSPDGSQIAFVRFSASTANHEIFVIDADGSNEANVTNSAADDLEPAWSPDGTQLAFISDRGSDTGRLDVFTMAADGSGSATSVAEDVDGLGLDWQPVLPGPAVTQVIPEGATHSGFTTFLLLSNPDTISAQVDVRFLTPGGAVAPAAVQDLVVPPGRRRTVNVNTALGQSSDVAIEVTSVGGTLVAQAAMQRSGSLAAVDLNASDATSSRWVIAEGATHSGFTTFVTLANPAAEATEVDLTFLPKGGSPTTKADVPVPAGGRTTVNVNTECACSDDVSTVVDVASGQPAVVAAMSIHKENQLPGTTRKDLGIGGSLGVPDTATTWVVAEGATHSGWATFVLIANPDDATTANVDVTFLRKNGDPVTLPADHACRSVAPQRRCTIAVNNFVSADDVSTLVQATQGEVAVESSIQKIDATGFVIGDSVGSAGASIDEASSPAWMVADGATHSGFTTFILIANPDVNTDAVVDVTFLPKSKSAVTLQDQTIPAGKRVTIAVNSHVSEDDVSTLVETVSGNVVVEMAIDKVISGNGFLKGRALGAGIPTA